MKRIAIIIALASTPAYADGSAWTDAGGTTHYQDNSGGYASSYQDSVGQTHVQSLDGRQGTVWQDGGGVTHYEGDLFGR